MLNNDGFKKDEKTILSQQSFYAIRFKNGMFLGDDFEDTKDPHSARRFTESDDAIMVRDNHYLFGIPKLKRAKVVEVHLETSYEIRSWI